MSDNKDTITIKIKRNTHSDLGDLIKQVTAEGWSSVGANRTDAPTYATLVEEAIARLRVKKSRR